MARNIVLHMGFLNVPYTEQTMAAPVAAAKAAGARQRLGFTKTMTAEKVANILENKYNIVEVFNQIHGEEIMEQVHKSFHDVSIKHLTETRKPISEPMVRFMKPTTDEIQRMFKYFLRMEEMNGHLANPIKAAETGKGRRSKKSGPPFIDTGIYMASFRCWADIK